MLEIGSERYFDLCFYMIDSQIESLEYHNTTNKEIDPEDNKLIGQEVLNTERIEILKHNREKLVSLKDMLELVK